MAEASQITSTMNWALSKLSSLIPRASSSSSPKKHQYSADQELRKLESTMRRIRATLEDAEERDIIDKSDQLRLTELREVAYDIEDLIDDYEYEVLRVKVKARRMAMAALGDDKRDQVLDWNSFSPEVLISDDLIDRMREVREKFEEITDEWKRISFLEKERKRPRVLKWSEHRETTSFLDPAATFGRRDEKEKIIEWLLQERNEPHGVSVFAIIGMGGIGKTTLAQSVYRDPRVSKHFDLSAWICVSENFDVGGLLRKIINSLFVTRENKLFSHEPDNTNNMRLDMTSQESDNIHNMTLEVLCRCLHNKLQGKKFFIVLDDVWNQKLDLWESLKRPLNDVGFGKIILTTRNVAVAKIMQTSERITLKDLPFDDCLSLFVRIAFQGRDHNLNRDLLDIGTRIVKKCKGLPLAVKVLAGILSYEEEEERWKDILESELLEVESENNNVLHILKLSYNHMPMELRPCFMYLSLFGKDSRFRKVTVVEQWMSQGFLQAKGKQTEEDVGNSYFEELVQRSILQDNGWFIMHDLIHDLAQSIAIDEYSLITSDKLCQIPKTIRHLSVYLKDGFDIVHLIPLFESKSLRTLLLHGDGQFQIVGDLPTLIAGSCHNLKCLRTLVLYDASHFNGQYRMLPDALRHLKHLRYLHICNCDSAAEPLYSLYHLQTFISEYDRVELGSGIGDLINLRHLGISAHSYMHHEIGWLTDLRRLRCFKVGAESWQLKLRDLKGLANLRGLLCISGLENVKGSEITVPGAFMKTLQGVDVLSLDWHGNSKTEMDENDIFAEHVFDCFQPHYNLLRMYISGYPCAALPTWLGDASFFKLQYLSIWGSNCTSLPTLGQLPALEILRLYAMKRVKIVGRELLESCSNPPPPAAGAATASVRTGFGFPSLEDLEFGDMVAWEEWNGVEDVDFPRLRRLGIWNCPKLRALPTLHSVTTLTYKFNRMGNPELLSGRCLPMLQTLNLGCLGVPSLILPDYQILRSIKKLLITGDQDLTFIEGIGNLTCLQHLEIKGCKNARISPNEQLPPGLREVEISGSREVERWYKNQLLNGGDSINEQQSGAFSAAATSSQEKAEYNSQTDTLSR